MLRKDTRYEGKRTKNHLKDKKMQDHEYRVKRLETGPFRIINSDIDVYWLVKENFY